ncbi:MaoC/PaaZ C-terminal domain-containing protein [Ferrovibrio sp.]|uniref:MaoC/PaaZ C-terminal domain-containing protein n=1 Tax=Ferrovibrio sp. TaxID=1917215 RepID=UPI003D0F0B9E
MNQHVPSMIQVGYRLPDLSLPPISRKTLALFAGASHDHTAIHIEPAIAQAMGHEDVIAHGMLVMASMARLLTRWRPQRNIQRLKARFLATVAVGDALSFTGHVASLDEHDGLRCAGIIINGATQHGHPVITGEADVIL